MLPVKFEALFKAAGIKNIHHPKYGCWWETVSHEQTWNVYNKAWEDFFRAAGKPDAIAVEQFAKQMCAKYRLDAGF